MDVYCHDQECMKLHNDKYICCKRKYCSEVCFSKHKCDVQVQKILWMFCDGLTCLRFHNDKYQCCKYSFCSKNCFQNHTCLISRL